MDKVGLTARFVALCPVHILLEVLPLYLKNFLTILLSISIIQNEA